MFKRAFVNSVWFKFKIGGGGCYGTTCIVYAKKAIRDVHKRQTHSLPDHSEAEPIRPGNFAWWILWSLGEALRSYSETMYSWETQGHKQPVYLLLTESPDSEELKILNSYWCLAHNSHKRYILKKVYRLLLEVHGFRRPRYMKCILNFEESIIIYYLNTFLIKISSKSLNHKNNWLQQITK